MSNHGTHIDVEDNYGDGNFNQPEGSVGNARKLDGSVKTAEDRNNQDLEGAPVRHYGEEANYNPPPAHTHEVERSSTQSATSQSTQETNVTLPQPPPILNTIDVAAFIINKMLDRIFPRPALFSYILYTYFFVVLLGTATNSMQLAFQVMSLRYPSLRADKLMPGILDEKLLRGLAVGILSIFCLFHYFSDRFGRILNKYLAVFKILMLIGLAAGGLNKIRTSPANDFNSSVKAPASSHASAILLILFSFQGWENATFVAGEIPSYTTLRAGFITAVSCVAILYIVVNTVFLGAIPYATDFKPTYAAQLFGGSDGWKVVWAVFIAISASGNLVGVTYTCAKVKQVIGASNVLPWSHIWEKDSRMEPETPQGGLILHWIFSVVMVISTIPIGNIYEAISFPSMLQTYGHGIVGGLMLIAYRKANLPTPPEFWTEAEDQWFWTRSNTSKFILGLTYLVINLAILIIPLFPPYETATHEKRDVKGWILAAVNGGVLLFAAIHYLATFSSKSWTCMRMAGVTYDIVAIEEDSRTDRFRYQKKVVITLIRQFIETPLLKQTIYRVFGGSDVMYGRNILGQLRWRRMQRMQSKTDTSVELNVNGHP
ncbi:amino acid permease-domain-containing protein [Trichophaea hybrida]|nr:amino acid permease-domain-containing protein [Trichophaea hybrida]